MLTKWTFLTAMAAGGCDARDRVGAASRHPGEGAAPKKAYVFGVIAKSQSNPVFQAARMGGDGRGQGSSARSTA